MDESTRSALRNPRVYSPYLRTRLEAPCASVFTGSVSIQHEHSEYWYGDSYKTSANALCVVQLLQIQARAITSAVKLCVTQHGNRRASRYVSTRKVSARHDPFLPRSVVVVRHIAYGARHTCEPD